MVKAALTLHTLFFSYLICANLVFGFVLKKRTYSGYDGRDNRLEDALKVIEQEQQRLSDQRDAIEEVLESAYYRGIADEDIGDVFANEDDAIPDEYNEMIEMPEPEDDEYEPAMQELEDILSSEDAGDDTNEEWYDVDEGSPIRQKKTIPYALGGVVPGEKRSAEEEADFSDEETLSEDEVNALFHEADAALSDNMEDHSVDNEESGAPSEQETLEPVSEEELTSVLDDDNSDVGSEEEEFDQTSEYWPVYPDTTTGTQKAKKKRSPLMVAAHQVEDSGEIANAKEYIKSFLELEDDENTNLANALNLATLAQVEQNDKFITEEVEFLRNAIEDEQRIQVLKAKLNHEDSDDESEGEDIIEESVVPLPGGGIFEESVEYEEVPLQRKRSDPEEPLFDDEYDEMDDEINEVDDVDKLDREMIQRILEEKLREYLMRTKLDEYRTDNRLSEAPEDEWFNRKYDDNVDINSMDEQDWQLNPFLRELMQQYGDSNDVEKREYNDVIEDDEDNTAEQGMSTSEIADALDDYLAEYGYGSDQCPSLDMLDNCAVASSIGWHLDAEATDLCNRHQMCYTCGSAHGLSMETCDEGYLAEAYILCGDDDGCRKDADGLLDLMLLEGHVWQHYSESPDSCDAQCILKYVYGAYQK